MSIFVWILPPARQTSSVPIPPFIFILSCQFSYLLYFLLIIVFAEICISFSTWGECWFHCSRYILENSTLLSVNHVTVWLFIYVLHFDFKQKYCSYKTNSFNLESNSIQCWLLIFLVLLYTRNVYLWYTIRKKHYSRPKQNTLFLRIK